MPPLLGRAHFPSSALWPHVGDDADRPDQLGFGLGVPINEHSETNGKQIIELTNTAEAAGLAAVRAEEPSGSVPGFIKQLLFSGALIGLIDAATGATGRFRRQRFIKQVLPYRNVSPRICFN